MTIKLTLFEPGWAGDRVITRMQLICDSFIKQAQKLLHSASVLSGQARDQFAFKIVPA